MGLQKYLLKFVSGYCCNTFKVVFLLVQGYTKLMNSLPTFVSKVFKSKHIAKGESEAFPVPKYYVVCIFFRMIHVFCTLHCIRRIGTSQKMNKSSRIYYFIIVISGEIENFQN